jgi:hypothetical protein
VVHLATFFGANPREWFQPDWLVITIFYTLLGVTLLLAHVAEWVRKRRARAEGIELPGGNPCWFRAVMWLAVLYAVFNFFAYGMIDTARGEPTLEPDGTYTLHHSHGRPPTTNISQQEYRRLRRLGIRGFTGLFLCFYLQAAFDAVGAAAQKRRS